VWFLVFLFYQKVTKPTTTKYYQLHSQAIKMSTRNIIDLNNGAVSALQQGRHKEAVGLLRTATTYIKNGFASSGGKDNDGQSSPIKIDEEQDMPCLFSVPIWNEETCARHQDKTSIFMYSQALVLGHDDHCKELLTGVVFYNMALVNHARAIETEKASLLTAALNFYGMAVAVTQTRKGDSRASDYWLLLALYSNMAHIHMSRLCNEKLSQCLGNVRFLLAKNIAEQVVDADDYYFFLANSLLELRIDFAPAA
jgi:hypothetical protein